MSNSNDRNETGFGSGSLGVTGDNYDQNNARSGVNTDYRHPLAGGAGDVHPDLPPLGRALGATTYDDNSSHSHGGVGGVGSGGQRNIPAELERSTGHHSDAHRAAGEGATYGGVGGIMGAGLEREGDDSSRRTHDQHSHQSQSSTERNIPAELERSTGHHSAQHRAAGEGATYGGVGGIMGAGLEREGDDSSRRAHDQHSQSSTGRNIPSELERNTGHHSSEHRTIGAGATSGGVGGIMGAGLEREGHESSSHRAQEYSTEHTRHPEELTSGTRHSSRQQNVLAAGTGAGIGGIAAAGLGRDSQSSRSTYDSSNTSANRDVGSGAGQREGRVPGSVGDVKSVDDARAGMENLKMEHTDSEGFTDLTGGRQDKTDGNLLTGRNKNLDGSEKTPVVETSAKRSEKDAQGRELDSYGKPYTL